MAVGPGSSRPRWTYVTSLAVGVLVIMVAFVITKPAAHGTEVGPCVALEVSSSTEKDRLIAELAGQYNAVRKAHGRCVKVSVHKMNSGAAMTALANGWTTSRDSEGVAEPQVWLPSSSLWTRQLSLKANGRPVPPPSGHTSIANSPLVIAMPQPKAAVFRERGLLGWHAILGQPGGAWAGLGPGSLRGRITVGHCHDEIV